MSDTEDQNEPEELFFENDGIQLRFNSYAKVSGNDEKKYLEIKAEIEGKLARGEPVYCQIMDDRRVGSIGRIQAVTFTYTKGDPNNYWRANSYCGISDIEVVWDGRKNKVKPWPSDVEYLPDWTGGTIWHWTKGVPKDPVAKIIPYDHLGEEIEPDQFVCFVHRRYGNTSMKFGTVTRTTDKGGVFVKTLKLRDGDYAGEELRAYSASDLIIVNKQLISRLMMARLAAD